MGYNLNDACGRTFLKGCRMAKVKTIRYVDVKGRLIGTGSGVVPAMRAIVVVRGLRRVVVGVRLEGVKSAVVTVDEGKLS